ncbi:MAG: polysaccharide biosynthesis tyrosine autokinase [Fluviibacter phosphoraccumulans]
MSDHHIQTNGQDDDSLNISIADLLENIVYYRMVFFAASSLIFGIALIYALFATPIYTSDVLIQVEDKKVNVLSSALDNLAGGALDSGSKIAGEIEIFKSRSIIGRAVETLFLHTDVSVNNRIPLIGGLLYRVLPKDPAGLVIPPVDWIQAGWGGEDIVFDTFNVPNKYIAKPLYLMTGEEGAWELYNDNEELLASGRVGVETLSANGQWQINIKTLRAYPGTEFKLVRYSLQSRIKQVNQALIVKESGKQSGLFQATYDHKSPGFSQRMINAIAQSYVDQNTERRAEEAEKSLQFLSRKLPELKAQMESSDTALTGYRNENAKLDVSKEIDTLIQQAVALGQTKRELEFKKSEHTQRYQSAHPVIKAIDSQLSKIKAEAETLEQQIRALPESQQRYVNIEREAQINSKLYQGLLETSQQLQVTKAGTVANVSVIDYAVLPDAPSKPNKLLVVALGGVLGVLLGAVAANLFGFLMGNVRDPKKLEESLGLKMLAILPLAKEQDIAISNKTDGQSFMLAQAQPNATSVEAIRSLRIALQFALLNKPRQKVVLITSAVPGQGKSFISANLAYLLAASGKKTLLIDADIRRTSLRNYLPIGKAVGLSEVLQQQAQLENVLVKDIYPGLDLIPAGRPARNPGELFVEGQLNQIVDSAAANYELVIIDSPPVLPVNDAVVMARLADVTVFVARQDRVTLHEINEALELFKKSGTTPDGMVFNAFIPSQMRYGFTRYGYYAYRYGGRYGRYGRYGCKYQPYDNYGLDQPPPEDASTSHLSVFKVQARTLLRQLGKKTQKTLTNIFRRFR